MRAFNARTSLRLDRALVETERRQGLALRVWRFIKWALEWWVFG